jgi:16S rRNA processing protein RimM
MNERPDALLAGQVGKPHGIAGEVYVDPISDDPSRFEPGSRLLHESAGPLVVASARRHGDRLLVAFEGIISRTQAEGLRGALYVGADQLRRLGPGEYWEHELEGCAVVQRDGSSIGKVERVVAAPAQDLLAVSTPKGERLVPVVRDIVVSVDPGARRIVVDPPAGLLD